MELKLRFIQIKEDAIIHSFVLMNNHFHLILSTPKGNISKVMYWFMKTVTLEIQRQTQRINKIFGGRYKACLITTERYLFNATRYIYQNPLRAEIVGRAEQYKFSTLYTLINNQEIKFKHTPNCIINLEHINKNYTVEERKNIKLALSRTEFRPPKDRSYRRALL